jgi:hypothetical protein
MLISSTFPKQKTRFACRTKIPSKEQVILLREIVIAGEPSKMFKSSKAGKCSRNIDGIQRRENLYSRNTFTFDDY